jgi:hypothetical protein
MVNITIQNLEVESTALNQVSSGEMEKVIGGFMSERTLGILMNAFMFQGLTESLLGAFTRIVDIPPVTPPPFKKGYCKGTYGTCGK